MFTFEGSPEISVAKLWRLQSRPISFLTLIRNDASIETTVVDPQPPNQKQIANEVRKDFEKRSSKSNTSKSILFSNKKGKREECKKEYITINQWRRGISNQKRSRLCWRRTIPRKKKKVAAAVSCFVRNTQSRNMIKINNMVWFTGTQTERKRNAKVSNLTLWQRHGYYSTYEGCQSCFYPVALLLESP